MRDVGGEALDRVHAAPDRLGHVAERAGEVADLVAAAREIGDRRRAAFGTPDAFGGVGQSMDRQRDAGRQIERGKHGDAERDQRNGDDGEARPAQRDLDALAGLGQEQCAQHLPIALHRHRDRQHQRAVGAAAHIGADIAGQRLATRDLVSSATWIADSP